MYISVNHLSKLFDGKRVLRDINLTVEQGSFVALLGPSGCGKTTLLNAIAGVVGVEEGSITIDGKLYSDQSSTMPPEQRRIGMVFQDFALWPHMTVYENVAFGLKVQKQPREKIRSRVAEVLEIVRMTGFEKRYPHQLSGGQKQRVAIARALAPEPAVLLMDEPLSSLDAKLREEMRWQLTEIVNASGVTTIYVTHDQVEALSMANHIVLMNNGRIEQQGSPVELYDCPRTVFAASFIGASNLLPCRVLECVETRHAEGPKSDVWEADCGGFRTHVTGVPDGVRQGMWMVRPSDILVLDLNERTELDAVKTVLDSPSGVGTSTALHASTSLIGLIRERAFLGDTWLYRISVGTGNRHVLEVWSATERQVGETVQLLIPTAKARFVEGSAQIDVKPLSTVH